LFDDVSLVLICAPGPESDEAVVVVGVGAGAAEARPESEIPAKIVPVIVSNLINHRAGTYSLRIVALLDGFRGNRHHGFESTS
jgi:hypothetical protein